MKLTGALAILMSMALGQTLRGQATPNKVESPTVKVLTGLTVPEFEREMQHFVQAIGVSCGGCHMPKGNFASDENERKVKARQMIEMTTAINEQFFPTHKPAEGESTLGRVTCFTCHQGDAKPKVAPGKAQGVGPRA
jgi:mono/diheme cytochrome c family protein